MAKEELCRAVIALVGRLITCILTSWSSSRRHSLRAPERWVGVRHEGRGRVLTRTTAIRQERAAVCTQWSVNEDTALWDGTRKGPAAWNGCQRERTSAEQAGTGAGWWGEGAQGPSHLHFLSKHWKRTLEVKHP